MRLTVASLVRLTIWCSGEINEIWSLITMWFIFMSWLGIEWRCMSRSRSLHAPLTISLSVFSHFSILSCLDETLTAQRCVITPPTTAYRTLGVLWKAHAQWFICLSALSQSTMITRPFSNHLVSCLFLGGGPGYKKKGFPNPHQRHVVSFDPLPHINVHFKNHFWP